MWGGRFLGFASGSSLPLALPVVVEVVVGSWGVVAGDGCNPKGWILAPPQWRCWGAYPLERAIIRGRVGLSLPCS